MKKVGLISLGIIATIILLANLGSLIGLGISVAILYYSIRQIIKTDSIWSKITWVIIALIALSAAISMAPSILGLVAAYILYLVYKKWNSTKGGVVEDQADPFTNFEKQWSELNKK